MYNSSYSNSSGRGSDQPSRPKMQGNYGSNENYPLSYGQGVPQFYPPNIHGMNVQPERRPLHTVQPMALSYQNQQPHQTFSSSQTLERQPSSGFTPCERPSYSHGLSESMDFPMSGQIPSAGYPRYCPDSVYSQESLSRLPSPGYGAQGQGGRDYANGVQGQSMQSQSMQSQSMQSQSMQGQSMQSQSMQGQSMQSQPMQSRMFCDQPPASFSGFMPLHTDLQPYLQQPFAEQLPRLPRPSQLAQPSPLPHQNASLWARPVGIATFDNQQPPSTIPSKRNDQLPSGVRGVPNPATAPKTSNPTPTASTPTPPKGAAPITKPAPSFSIASNSSFSSSGAGSERAGRPPRTPERGLCVLTGTVDNILVWGNKLDEEARPDVHFEIVGLLDSVVRGQWHSSRLVCLRSLEGSATLSAVFWEIDRPLFAPPTGSIVSCVCRLGPKWPPQRPTQTLRRMPRMQMLNMRSVSTAQVVHYKRLAYVSSQAVQQGVLSAPAAPARTPGTPADKLAAHVSGQRQGTATSRPAKTSSAPPSTPLKQTLISSYTSSRTSRP